ncbi:hypothetical protein L227DRAFT_608426 [Lentinus tigrinus ALCF2SS1-6]|uniref:Uncharacterized protein n=1 Tax=Lentinus tigrinus ALCF2SS1-6 TaxID=1328759 RepID=A0A5C2SQZ0_9APHY|nr:hypothetical protein L227DRAFT_608426 [Lentinus tigrinus ALCF2SS1-6]
MDGKRKRDDEGTVVTFYAPNRTFARVYKGQSLRETQDIVRKKLGLSDDAPIRFARLHEGKVIELDDDDDFEAFRHLARYATSLDVSVFVGQDGPPIFTRQSSREASVIPKPSRKRMKKLHQPIMSSVIAPDPVSVSRSSTAERSSRLSAAASTVDANGVPKEKRRRNVNVSVDSSPLLEPSSDMHAAHPKEPVRGEATHFQHHSSHPGPASSSLTQISSSTHNVAPSSSDAVDAPRGSKRKRRDSPETSHSIPVVPPSSSPPRLPSKKKRKHGRVVEDTTTSVEEATSGRTAKSDKKGRSKGRNITETAEPLKEARATASGEDVPAGKVSDGKKSAKKAKDAREKDARGQSTPETESTFAKQSQKRKHKDVPIGEPVDAAPAIQPESVQDSTSHTEPGSKDKPKSKIPRDGDQGPPGAIAPSMTVSSSIQAMPAEDETGKRSVSKVLQNVSFSTMDTAEHQGKQSKRRQTIQIVDVASDSSPIGEITSAHEEVESEVVSSKKAKQDRKKSLPASSGDSPGPSPAAMAAVQAAYEALMARGTPASTAEPTPPPPLLLTPPVPARKRNTGKSKLSNVWGPDDLADDSQSSASVSAPAATQNAPAMGEPIAVVDTVAPPKGRTSNAKKARSSSAPTCPICEQAAVHPRSECPVVTAGALSLRKRFTQLKKDGADDELIKEVAILVKEVQRRRRTTATALSVPPVPIIPAPAPSGDVPPSSPELPLQSLSTAPSRRPSLPNRSLPSPRLPAGSEISEVAVESKDEGSSNESSSSDDEDNASAPAHSVSASAIIPDPTNLEALLWRPVKPRTSVLAQIPSESESDNESAESNDEADKDVDVDLEEEEKNDRAFRRMSRRFERAVSSSDDEREPEPEPADPDMDVDDVIIPPTTMDPDPNDSVEDARQVEADVLAREDSALLRGAAESDKEEGDEEKDEVFAEEMREMLDDPDAADEESDEEEPVPTKPASEQEGSPASESGKSRAGSSPDASFTDYDASDRVEHAAEVNPLVSQEALDGIAEDADVEQGKSNDDAASVEDERYAESSMQVDGSSKASTEAIANSEAGNTEEHGHRELSPEVVGHVTSALAHAPSPQVEEDEDDATAVQVDVVEPYSEDPNDPIDSFSSVGDRERQDQGTEDPIEDPDASQPSAEAQMRTPPPATPRTPGTVSRMKDRYGRLPQARAKGSAPPLSRQLLGELVLSEAELTLPADAHPVQSEHGPVPELLEEISEEAHEQERGLDEEVLELEREKTQDSRESSELQQDVEEVPRRTTRLTRRISNMPPPSSLPEPTSTPAPAPPQRGRKRLTEEEKAQREAEKLEKKAERERKAAEKKAEREAKAAAKRAETEARKAAKLAEKEAKDAAQRALQDEVAKRGARAARGRGRGRGVKPMSTRSQHSVASVDEPEEERDVEQPEAQVGKLQVSETPAVGKISWATLSQSGLRTQTESVGDVDSSMTDELQPSSPELAPEGRATRGRKKTSSKEDKTVEEPTDEPVDRMLDAVTPKPKGIKEPLFIPSSSQVPTRFGMPDAESTPFPDDHLHGSDSEAEEQDKTFKGPPRSRPSWFSQAMYPTLTDLASQQLFPATQIPSPALFSQSSSKKLVSAPYDKGGEDGEVDETSDDDDDDDDDDVSSDSDGEKSRNKSHIPHNRRAGASVQKKKKPGLLSAYK